jgi:hypothetical protein
MNEELIKLLERIASKYLGIESLSERKSDSLDFHNVSVVALKKALTEAFRAGATVGLDL